MTEEEKPSEKKPTEEKKEAVPAEAKPAAPPVAKPPVTKPPFVPAEEFVRVRMPNAAKREVLGVVQEHHGSKLLIKCVDGFTRMCRIPGKIRYKLRIKPGHAVLVQKWEIQVNEKGDYIWKYTPAQTKQLIRKGLLKPEDLEV